jgi:hypothetical protein
VQSLTRFTDYAATLVLRALRGRRAQREWRFRYELLTRDNIRIRDLDNVVGGSVAHDFLAETKRTAKFVIADDGTINFLNQRIRPWAGIRMQDGGYMEWPLGVFLLTTPTRKVDISGVVTRDVEAYDQTVVLQDDTLADRYFVNANYPYTDAINELLSQTPGITQTAITPSTAATPSALEWEPGTSKYQVIADMLSAINYGSLWFDGTGVARATPYVSPRFRAAEFEYRTDDVSVILPGADQSLDLFSLPNRWVLIVSNSDQPPLRAEVRNTDPASPTSIPNRGRIITRVITDSNAPTQAMLTAIAERYKEENGQVYETISFRTGLMPFHENGDVYDLEYSGFVGYGRFMETSWEMDLAQGAEMKHEARRAVSILGGFGTGPFGTMPFGG